MKFSAAWTDRVALKNTPNDGMIPRPTFHIVECV